MSAEGGPEKPDTQMQVINEDDVRLVAQGTLDILNFEYGAVPNRARNAVPAIIGLMNGLLTGDFKIVKEVEVPVEPEGS